MCNPFQVVENIERRSKVTVQNILSELKEIHLGPVVHYGCLLNSFYLNFKYYQFNSFVAN